MSKNRIKFIVIMILAVASGFGVYSFARYVVEEYHDYYLNSKNFYFSSNRLTEDNALYQVNNWSGIGSFDISFDLLSMKNSLVYTDYDIPYTVSYECPTDVICSISSNPGIIYANSQNHSSTVTLSVNPQREYNEQEVMTIVLHATSTSPYEKTISARFEYIVGKKGISYEIEDKANRTYLVLRITNANNSCTVINAFGNYSVGAVLDYKTYRGLSSTNKDKCVSEYVTLSFDANDVFFDNTSNLLKTSQFNTTSINGVEYITSIIIPIEPLSSTALRFYKNDTSRNYTFPYENNTSIISFSYQSPN